MNETLKILFSKISPGMKTGRELEQDVITRFNQHLEMFPPGYGPEDAIEDGIRENVIVPTNGKYKVKKVR